MSNANDEFPSLHIGNLVYGPDGADWDDPAEAYHEASKNRAFALHPAGWRTRTLLVLLHGMEGVVRRASRAYIESHRQSLPTPLASELSLAEILVARESRRDFDGRPIDCRQLSTLLYYSYGQIGRRADGRAYRSVPSGGALYPLEIFVYAANVDGLTPAIYHYNPIEHYLELVSASDVAEKMRAAAIDRVYVEGAAALIVITATFWRSRFKYGLRGYRYTLLEAGHVGQNALLAAAAMRLSALPVGGIYDARLESDIGIDGVNESVVYAISIGRSE